VGAAQVAEEDEPMAGTAGTRGPVPKRSSERRRRNKESQVEQVKPLVETVDAPPAEARWHAIARDWYESLRTSGQARYFEPSDWQAARYVAEVMSRHLKARRLSAQLFAGIWSAMSDLLTTEASRRRVRMEIEREMGEPAEKASVTAIADYRKVLRG